MITAVGQGIFAGLAIAIPIGAIGILIVETGLRRGFRHAWAAGAGTASADCIYATILAAAGVALDPVIAPLQRPLQVVAVVALMALGVRGISEAFRNLRVAREGAPPVRQAGGAGAARTYATFLGLTLLNPMTIVYFASLLVGLHATLDAPVDKAAFVAGAFGASLAWQSVLAAAGALLHRRLGPGLRVGVSLLGNAIILVFAASIAWGLVR